MVSDYFASSIFLTPKLVLFALLITLRISFASDGCVSTLLVTRRMMGVAFTSS